MCVPNNTVLAALLLDFVFLLFALTVYIMYIWNTYVCVIYVLYIYQTAISYRSISCSSSMGW